MTNGLWTDIHSLSFVEPLWGPHSFQLLVCIFTPIDYWLEVSPTGYFAHSLLLNEHLLYCHWLLPPSQQKKNSFSIVSGSFLFMVAMDIISFHCDLCVETVPSSTYSHSIPNTSQHPLKCKFGHFLFAITISLCHSLPWRWSTIRA